MSTRSGKISQAEIWEDQAVTTRARLEKDDGTAIVQADVTEVRVKVLDRKTEQVITNATLTISSVIYNTLQTTGWTEDALGYNFKHSTTTGQFDGGRSYRLEYTISTVADGPLTVAVDVKALPKAP